MFWTESFCSVGELGDGAGEDGDDGFGSDGGRVGGWIEDERIVVVE